MEKPDLQDLTNITGRFQIFAALKLHNAKRNPLVCSVAHCSGKICHRDRPPEKMAAIGDKSASQDIRKTMASIVHSFQVT